MPTLILCDENHWTTLSHLMELYYRDISSPEAQEALLYFLQMHASRFEKAPEILEDMICKIDTQDGKTKTSFHRRHSKTQSVEGTSEMKCNFSLQLKLSLLNAMVHVCLERPAKVQQMLSRFMEKCICDENRVIRDRALFLYGYLLSEVKQKLLHVKVDN